MRSLRTVASAAATCAAVPALVDARWRAKDVHCAGAMLSRTDTKAATQWKEEYSLVRKIGAGAFASVWLATPRDMPDPANPPKFALKIMNPKHKHLLTREADALRRAGKHPNLATLLDEFSAVEGDATIALVLEYAEACPRARAPF